MKHTNKPRHNTGKPQSGSATNNEMLPYSPETERCVVGMLLLESAAIHEISDIITPEVFYTPSLQLIYSAIASLSEKGDKPDMVGVMKQLSQGNRLDEAGGPLALSQLTTAVSSTQNIAGHARYLHQLYLARRLWMAAEAIRMQATDPTRDIDDVLGESLQLIESVADLTTTHLDTLPLGLLARRCVDLYHTRMEQIRAGLHPGVPSGLSKLNRLTGGWQPGELILNAARPAMGKTAFMLHFARAAAEAGVQVVIFSLEMSRESLVNRFLVSDSGVDPDHFKNGLLTPEEQNLIYISAGNLSRLPIYIDDTANLSVQQIKVRASNLRRRSQCGFVLIDYLQLLDMRTANRNYNREQEVAQCTRAIKLMAKELSIPVMLLSQLSRKNVDRADKTPYLSDLRESGAIEQDADIVLFIHRPEYYNEPGAIPGVGTLRIAKQRNGTTGDMLFRYNESLTRITDYDTV